MAFFSNGVQELMPKTILYTSIIDKYQHMHFFTFNTLFFKVFFNYSVTLTRYRPTPWWWSVKIETCL